MSFWHKHVVPTLHNAIGGLLATAIAALFVIFLGLFRPALLRQSVPLWAFLLTLLAVISLGWLRRRALKRKLQETNKQLADANAKVAKQEQEMTKRFGEAVNRWNAADAADLDPTEVEILLLLGKDGLRMSPHDIQNKLGLGSAKGEYFLTRLRGKSFIRETQIRGAGVGEFVFEIAPRGTEYLIKRGLL